MENSISSGQVLQCPYTFEKSRVIVKEMTDLLVLDLVDKGLVTNQIVLTIGYDIENLVNPDIKKNYSGEVTIDYYGRKVPKHAHGTGNLAEYTSSTKQIMEVVMDLFDRIVNPKLLVRRINVVANHLKEETTIKVNESYEQMELFTDYTLLQSQREKEQIERIKERKIQEAILKAQKKYGKNAILKGINLEEGATTIERNKQIGGHKA